MANGGDRLSRPYLSTDMAERLLDRNAKLIAGVLRLRASANEAREKEGFVTATGTENSDPAAAKRFDRRADRLEDQLARNLAALARWARGAPRRRLLAGRLRAPLLHPVCAPF